MEGNFPEGQKTSKRGRRLALGHSEEVEKAQNLGSENMALGLSTDTHFSNFGMVSGLVVGGVPGASRMVPDT